MSAAKCSEPSFQTFVLDKHSGLIYTSDIYHWYILNRKKGAAMEQEKLQTKDFISIGIFSLIYSVVAFVVGGIAQMTPLTFPLMPACIALFTGTVFML